MYLSEFFTALEISALKLVEIVYISVFIKTLTIIYSAKLCGYKHGSIIAR